MTDLEKMQWQTEQDQTVLDFSKWSQQQTRAGLSNDHNLWKELRDDVLARQQASNAETRRKYLDGLEAAKAERQRERDEEIDRELEPQKQRMMRDWLVNNPNETADSFGKKAWVHLRENLIEERKTAVMDATAQQLRASGRYNL